MEVALLDLVEKALRVAKQALGNQAGARIWRASPRGSYRRSLYSQKRRSHFRRTRRSAWIDASSMRPPRDSFRGIT